VPEDQTVWLVGMMGAGKSTLGPALAARLRCDFVDADAEIERAAGCTIAELFDREGEAAFRSSERAVLESLAGRRTVVALGGGAIAQPGVQDQLSGSGTVVYLRARLETLLARLGDASTRPLLRGLAPAERRARLAALLAERSAAYESAAIVIDTDCGSPETLSETLLARLCGPSAA
jgi:shikimate kinase